MDLTAHGYLIQKYCIEIVKVLVIHFFMPDPNILNKHCVRLSSCLSKLGWSCWEIMAMVEQFPIFFDNFRPLSFHKKRFLLRTSNLSIAYRINFDFKVEFQYQMWTPWSLKLWWAPTRYSWSPLWTTLSLLTDSTCSSRSSASTNGGGAATVPMRLSRWRMTGKSWIVVTTGTVMIIGAINQSKSLSVFFIEQIWPYFS